MASIIIKSNTNTNTKTKFIKYNNLIEKTLDELISLLKNADNQIVNIVNKHIDNYKLERYKIKKIYFLESNILSSIYFPLWIVVRENNLGEIFTMGSGRLFTSHIVVEII